MKAGREHRVPLSVRILAILAELESVKQNEFVFPGTRTGRPSKPYGAVNAPTKDEALGHHGPWLQINVPRLGSRDAANFPNFVVEMALAHVVANKVEGAYRRGDLFAKRRKLMETWDAYCEKQPSRVLPMSRRN